MDPSSENCRHLMENTEHSVPTGAANGMEKKRLAIAYASLVGVPLLGLIGILEVGREVRAPIGLSGIWDVQADLRPLAPGQCAPLAASGQPVLTISQSGRHLAVALNRMQGSGSVEDSTVNAVMSAGDGSCGAVQEYRVYLQANVERSAADERMTGIIGVSGCVDCTEVYFRAIRRPASPRVGP